MSYFENDGAPAENAPEDGGTNGIPDPKEDHLEGGLTEEDEQFIESVEAKDVDDMTVEERDYLKEVLGKAKTTIGQKNHYKTKYTELLKHPKLVETKPEPKQNNGAKPQASNNDAAIRTQKMEFRMDHKDLTKDQVEEVFTYAALKKITPEAAMKTTFVKKYLESAAADREAEDASGHPSSGGGARPKAQPTSYKTMDSKTFQEKRRELMRKNRQ